jgi:hypothetical protein
MQGAPQEFLHVPCLLHAKQHPSPLRTVFFFSSATPSQTKKNKESSVLRHNVFIGIGSIAYYLLKYQIHHA